MPSEDPPSGEDRRGRDWWTRRDFTKATGVTVGGLAVGGATTGSVSAGIETPWLHRDGKWLEDPNGNRVVLRGINTVDPKRTAENFRRSIIETIDHATDPDRDWYARVIRIPAQPVDIGGYPGGSNPDPVAFSKEQLQSYITNHLKPAVDRCAERGVYCIVDYHRHRYDDYTDPALDDELRLFWNEVAPVFADYSNVLFEVYNEPTYPFSGDPTTAGGAAQDTWETWKATAQPWVDIIREHAPRNIIVIGSPRWTQWTAYVPRDEFEGENLAYAGHVYTHESLKPWEAYFGDAAEEVPVMITEWGYQGGTGGITDGTTSGYGEPFKAFLNSHENLHWTAWCFDPHWTPVMFDDDWNVLGGEQYQGEFIREFLRERKDDHIPGGGGGGDTTPPTTPSNLSVPDRTTSSIDLDWTASTDSGGSGLDHYVVYLDGSQYESVPAGTTGTSVTGLDSGTTYELAVSAVDGAGNESSPGTVTAETAPSEQSPYNGPHTLPGTVQAEDFDRGGEGVAYNDTTDGNFGGAYRSTNVDIEPASESGYNIGWIEAEEWWEYTVEVEQTGTYDFEARVASAMDGGAFHVEIDGTDVTGSISFEGTGSWQTWTTVSATDIELTEGSHVVRIDAEVFAWNLNWFAFELQAGDAETVVDPCADFSTVASGTETGSLRVDGSNEHAFETPEGSTDGDRFTRTVTDAVDVVYAPGGTLESLSVEYHWHEGEQGSVTYLESTDGGSTWSDVTADRSSFGSFDSDWWHHEIHRVTDFSAGATHVALRLDGDGAAWSPQIARVELQFQPDTGPELLVDDFTGSSWPGDNDLGNWAGAGDFQNGDGELTDGAVVLEYDNGGWFVERLLKDISDFSELVLRVKGASGGEETDFTVALGGATALCADVADSGVTTEFTEVRVDLEALGADLSWVEQLDLNFWQGGASTLVIDEIRLE